MNQWTNLFVQKKKSRLFTDMKKFFDQKQVYQRNIS